MPRLGFLSGGLTAMVLLFGCTASNSNLYYWGAYENSIYTMYLEPEKDSFADQILRLEEQIEKTAATSKAVPPGLHAHLGYLYAKEGDYAKSHAHFETEKTLFPESRVFIDGLIERMKK